MKNLYFFVGLLACFEMPSALDAMDVAEVPSITRHSSGLSERSTVKTGLQYPHFDVELTIANTPLLNDQDNTAIDFVRFGERLIACLDDPDVMRQLQFWHTLNFTADLNVNSSKRGSVIVNVVYDKDGAVFASIPVKNLSDVVPCICNCGAVPIESEQIDETYYKILDLYPQAHFRFEKVFKTTSESFIVLNVKGRLLEKIVGRQDKSQKNQEKQLKEQADVENEPVLKTTKHKKKKITK